MTKQSTFKKNKITDQRIAYKIL